MSNENLYTHESLLKSLYGTPPKTCENSDSGTCTCTFTVRPFSSAPRAIPVITICLLWRSCEPVHFIGMRRRVLHATLVFNQRRPNLLDRRLAGELAHGAHSSAAAVLSRSRRLRCAWRAGGGWGSPGMNFVAESPKAIGTKYIHSPPSITIKILLFLVSILVNHLRQRELELLKLKSIPGIPHRQDSLDILVNLADPALVQLASHFDVFCFRGS